MTTSLYSDGKKEGLVKQKVGRENGRADDPGHYPVKGSRPFATLTVLFPAGPWLESKQHFGSSLYSKSNLILASS